MDHAPRSGTRLGSGVNGSIVDGYSSATAANYSGTHSPVIPVPSNCRDTNNVTVADGNYKFWVQYAGTAAQVTTSGLLWTKGAAGITNNYASQGANFTSMQVAWSPSTPAAPATPPNFTTFQVIGNNLMLSAPDRPTGLCRAERDQREHGDGTVDCHCDERV